MLTVYYRLWMLGEGTRYSQPIDTLEEEETAEEYIIGCYHNMNDDHWKGLLPGATHDARIDIVDENGICLSSAWMNEVLQDRLGLDPYEEEEE